MAAGSLPDVRCVTEPCSHPLLPGIGSRRLVVAMLLGQLGQVMTDNTSVLWPLLDMISPCCVINVLKFFFAFLRSFFLGLQGVAQPGSSAAAAA